MSKKKDKRMKYRGRKPKWAPVIVKQIAPFPPVDDKPETENLDNVTKY